MKSIFILISIITLSFCVIDRTYYIYLGLDISASNEDIQNAYQQKKSKILALQDEQTKNNKLKLLEQAYQVLGSQDRRQIYDRLSKDLYRKSSVVANLNKLTDKNARKSKTIQITLPVSVEDVYHGKTVEATFLKQTACEKCRGTGAASPKAMNSCSRCAGNGFTIVEGVNGYGQKFVNENNCQLCQGSGKQITQSCPTCGGKKIVSKLEKVPIRIPEGLPDGNVIKIHNFGDQPINGAPSDLQVTIVEIATQNWSREGENLIHTFDLAFKDSIFGFDTTITHLNGQQIAIARSEPTTKQTTITIPQKGILNKKTGRQGNLIIKFRIVMPKFTDEQLDMWEQFFRLHNI